MPLVDSIVEADSSDCGFIWQFEGNFNFYKDTNIFHSVDGKIPSSQGQELKELVVLDNSDKGIEQS
jgi:hypothetical protein